MTHNTKHVTTILKIDKSHRLNNNVPLSIKRYIKSIMILFNAFNKTSSEELLVIIYFATKSLLANGSY